MSYRKENKKAALCLSKEKRQEFLDMMRKGLSMEEARKRCGISLDEGIGIMDLNIVKHTYFTLNEESV